MQDDWWSDALRLLPELGQRTNAGDDRERHVQAAITRIAEGGWIAHHIPAAVDASGRAVKPIAAREAQEQRDAMLRLAAIRALAETRGQLDDQNAIDSLVQHVVAAAFAATRFGLWPRAGNSIAGPYRQADFAGSGAAAGFFDGHLRHSLARLACNLEPSLYADLLPHTVRAFDAADDASLLNWVRLWTCAAALAPLDWARSRQCRSTLDIARALWHAVGPEGIALPRVWMRCGPLPTQPVRDREGRRLHVHLELRTRSWLAQLIEGRTEWRDAPEDMPCAIAMSLKAIDYVSRMVGVEQQVEYLSRNVFQIHLAVLTEMLLPVPSASLARSRPWQPALAQKLPGTAAVADQVAAVATVAALSPLQLEGLRRIGSERGARDRTAGVAAPSRERRAPQRRLAPAVPETDRVAPLGWTWLDAAALAIESSGGDNGSSWVTLGLLSLAPAIDDDIAWLELTFTVRTDDLQRVVPVLLEEAESVAQAGYTVEGDEAPLPARHRLLMAPASAVDWTPDAWRRALAHPGALLSLAIRRGAGMVVVVELDLRDSQA